MTAQSGNSIEGPMLNAPTNRTTPGFMPMSASPAMTGGATPSGSFFTSVGFRGGITSDDDWTAACTQYPAN